MRPDQAALADEGAPAARLNGSEVTIVAPDRPGLLWQAAGVLASHRLAVRSANATSHGNMAVAAFTVAPEYGDPPDADLVTSDLRRALEGRLDVAERLERRMRAYRESPVPVRGGAAQGHPAGRRLADGDGGGSARPRRPGAALADRPRAR